MELDWMKSRYFLAVMVEMFSGDSKSDILISIPSLECARVRRFEVSGFWPSSFGLVKARQASGLVSFGLVGEQLRSCLFGLLRTYDFDTRYL
jgi:hypothetical protein